MHDFQSPPSGAARRHVTASQARILEFGDYFDFKRTFPERTTLLWTGRRPPKELPPGTEIDCTPRAFLRALTELRAGRYDILVVRSPYHPPWHPRQWLRSIMRTPSRPLAAFFRVFGVQLLRFFRIDVPVIAVDMADSFGINPHNFFLLDRAKIYFKREVPSDKWQLFYKTAHPNLPTSRIRHNARWRQRLERVQPVGIGVEEINLPEVSAGFPEKTTDVFFIGDVENNSTIRSAGLSELRALEKKGYRIDIPSKRLSHDEYCRRMAKAWLAWSPSGFGWECFRHYEAPQCYAVPVIDYPAILRYQPLGDGIHAFFYSPEPGGLTRAIEMALADKERLKRMAVAGRDFVRAYHTFPALCNAMIAAGLKVSS